MVLSVEAAVHNKGTKAKNMNNVKGATGQAADSNNPDKRDNPNRCILFTGFVLVLVEARLFSAVVRCFFGNVYIVRMAFFHACIGDFNKTCFL